MTEYIINLDTNIFLLLNGFHTPALDSFMMAFSGKFLWVPLYLAMAVLIVMTFGKKMGSLYILALICAIALSDQTCASIIRPFAERLRPSNPANPLSEIVRVVNGYRGGAYGFPSCHAANSFALVTFMSLLLRRRRLSYFLFAWAIINSYSRIYLGVHYPGDLLVGALIGSAFGAICYALTTFAGVDNRRRSLRCMGKPLFYIPVLNFGSGTLGTGITRGDLLISVGLAIVVVISLMAIL